MSQDVAWYCAALAVMFAFGMFVMGFIASVQADKRDKTVRDYENDLRNRLLKEQQAGASQKRDADYYRESYYKEQLRRVNLEKFARHVRKLSGELLNLRDDRMDEELLG